jgi:ATP-dependent helicase HrpB
VGFRSFCIFCGPTSNAGTFDAKALAGRILGSIGKRSAPFHFENLERSLPPFHFQRRFSTLRIIVKNALPELAGPAPAPGSLVDVSQGLADHKALLAPHRTLLSDPETLLEQTDPFFDFDPIRLEGSEKRSLRLLESLEDVAEPQPVHEDDVVGNSLAELVIALARTFEIPFQEADDALVVQNHPRHHGQAPALDLAFELLLVLVGEFTGIDDFDRIVSGIVENGIAFLDRQPGSGVLGCGLASEKQARAFSRKQRHGFFRGFHELEEPVAKKRAKGDLQIRDDLPVQLFAKMPTVELRHTQGIAQKLVGFGHLLKFIGCRGLRVSIGVIEQRQPMIGFLQLYGPRTRVHPQQFETGSHGRTEFHTLIMAPSANRSPERKSFDEALWAIYSHGMSLHLDPLPLDDAWSGIHEALKLHRNLVLVAEPGAGKTTRFPPRLLASGLLPVNQKILMLEPRRLAARASAHRIAFEQGWQVGREVGYQVRFENKTSPSTRLQILTEGLLARRLLSDPELSDIGAVILDEFHERSQHTDLALGLLFELQSLARPDLRLIVMSATLDAEKVSAYLENCPIIRVPGRTYPVTVHHSQRPLSIETGPGFLDRVSESVIDVVSGKKPSAGDVLVFLPGAREIRGVRERVATRTSEAGFLSLELHGSLPLEDQDRAIRRLNENSGYRGKIILSTNIAETSLTIDGVGTVIDSGLARVARTDSLGFSRLGLSRISLASATQRAGRAGRQGPGHCHRLWSRLDEASMPAFEQPELLRTDLTDPLLALLSQGVNDAEGFSWFEKPASSQIEEAQRTLTELGFRDPQTGALTPEGREALKLPLSARLARLLLEATRAGSTDLGARMAALLSERDPVVRAVDLKRRARSESDLLERLHLIDERDSRVDIDRVATANIRRVIDALKSSAGRIDIRKLPPAPLELGRLDDDDLALRLLLLSFPDRLCRRRRPKEPAARMVGGKGVQLAPFSVVETAEYFVALDSNEAPATSATASGSRSDPQITIASRVERDWIRALFPQAVSRSSAIVFDPDSLSVQKQTGMRFRDLPLEDAHSGRPDAEEAFPVLMDAARRHWDTHFAKHENLAQVLARLRFVRRTLAPEDPLWVGIESADSPVAQSFLEEVCFGETRLTSALEKPLGDAFIRHLPPNISSLLEDTAPERLAVPSGSRLRIHYPDDRDPYVEVRIQEMFGMRETPRVARQKVALVIHLLGPNFRPVQVTSDLASFWKNGYAEVRKELRARYPKHSWPDDPLTARPEAKGSRRRD